jgi:hypothetical protein
MKRAKKKLPFDPKVFLSKVNGGAALEGLTFGSFSLGALFGCLE